MFMDTLFIHDGYDYLFTTQIIHNLFLVVRQHQLKNYKTIVCTRTCKDE